MDVWYFAKITSDTNLQKNREQHWVHLAHGSYGVAPDPRHIWRPTDFTQPGQSSARQISHNATTGHDQSHDPNN